METDQGSMLPMTDISETLLIPLYARAFESQTKQPLLIDTKAVEITQELNTVFVTSDSKLHKTLAKGHVRRLLSDKLNATLALRTRRFDRYCLAFLSKNPGGVIVELGCGLSTRFPRIDAGAGTWYDLDLPEVIAIRQRFFNETERYHFIRSSVSDFTWMGQVRSHTNKILFLAEGLLMYLHEDEVRSLIVALQKKFPGCELVCEVTNAYIVKMLQRRIWKRKFQRDYHLGKDVTFHFGVRDGTEFEEWNEGITFLDEWTYFDDADNKLGWMNFFGRFEKMKKALWIVHYRLD
jgi:O-methyltransferase involved in polyketide biosynthesis